MEQLTGVVVDIVASTRRALILLVVVTWSLVVVTGSAALVVATATAASEPIVSPKADPYYRFGGPQGTKGFGRVKPREIYYEGDPTGLVCDIHWRSWGGRVARGTGVGWYVGANQSVGEGHAAIATVIASKLGSWNGRRAYNRLTWSFPNHGRDRSSSFCQ
jgi:hypothetical protein